MEKRLLLVAFALLALSACGFAFRQPSGPVKHYVVLMMENRAYDHLLGYFHLPGYHLKGLTGSEFNLWNPQDPHSRVVHVNPHAKDISPNPDHSVKGTTEQIFGTHSPDHNAVAKMDGFVMNSRTHFGDTIAPRIMQCWNDTHLPIITTLAKHFTLFDEWHASVPGPTFGNRMYFHAGTSDGVCHNVVPHGGFPIKTIYELLDDAGYDWHFYFDQVQDASFFKYTREGKFVDRMRKLKDFGEDAKNNRLPTLSFMMPRFFGEDGINANDQHPSHAVSLGEELIKKVYEELRGSPSWNASALLLTYDEHGGFYDHVPTPLKDVPNPDGKNCHDPVDFDFDRLGVRVPTILISPWVDHSVAQEPKGHMPSPSSKFEHSSFIATLTRMLGLSHSLTKRSEWAAPFDYLFTRTTPRTDCPLTLPPVDHHTLNNYLRARATAPEHLQPLDDLHFSYLQALNDMLGLHPDTQLDSLRTEHDAAQYVHELTRVWRERAKYQ